MATGTLIRKTALHSKFSMSRPPIERPETDPETGHAGPDGDRLRSLRRAGRRWR